MVKIPSDIIANSTIQRYNDMVMRQQKMMDRINGTELKRTALRADMLATKMMDRLEPYNTLKTYSQDLQTSLDRVNSLQTQIGSLQSLAKRMNDPLSLAASIERSHKLAASSELNGLASKLSSNVNLSTKFADDLNKSLRPALRTADRLNSLNLTGADRVLRGYTSTFEKLSSSAGMVGSDFAISLSRKRPKISRYQSEILEQILEEAEAFHEEYGDTEVEETAQEFLDTVPAAAEQVANSEYLVTLTLRQRRLVSGYLAFLVFLTFVSISVYGYEHAPETIQLFTAIGINIPTIPATRGAYKGSMYLLEKYLATNDCEPENDISD